MVAAKFASWDIHWPPARPQPTTSNQQIDRNNNFALPHRSPTTIQNKIIDEPLSHFCLQYSSERRPGLGLAQWQPNLAEFGHLVRVERGATQPNQPLDLGGDIWTHSAAKAACKAPSVTSASSLGLYIRFTIKWGPPPMPPPPPPIFLLSLQCSRLDSRFLWPRYRPRKVCKRLAQVAHSMAASLSQ